MSLRDTTDQSLEGWREAYAATPERKGELFTTLSGLESEPLTTPETDRKSTRLNSSHT